MSYQGPDDWRDWLIIVVMWVCALSLLVYTVNRTPSETNQTKLETQ